jgi:hypothetical protein
VKLIAHKRPANEKLDGLEYVRADGSRCTIEMPRQGILPHDLIHYVVEQGLGLREGFLSLVAAGGDARFVMEMTHDARGAARAVQAEALVEALQTQLWAGAFEREAFEYGVQTAAAARKVAAPALDRDASALFDRARELAQQWAQVPPHGMLTLEFQP